MPCKTLGEESCAKSVEKEVTFCVNMGSTTFLVSEFKSKEIAEATVQDAQLQNIVENMLNAWLTGSGPLYYHIRD